MNRFLFSLLIICLGIFSVNAQTGNSIISGTVVDANQNPILGANVTLVDTGFGNVTNEEGNFKLTNVPTGPYTLKISYVGFQAYTQEISINYNEKLKLGNIALSYNEESLQTVLIEGDKINKFSREKSLYVSKLPLKDIENPQVYNTITSDLMESQVITNFDDALKNAPGIYKLWESTGRGNDGAGYYSVRGFPVQPSLTNGLPALTNGSPDPANIERIEIMKGPSGTLYGSSLVSYGGLINIATKKPYNSFGGNISYTTGSYGLNRVTADINAPLKEGVALRVNTAYHTQNSFQDAGFRKSFYIAPSLSYKVNDRLSFLINTELFNGESTNQTMLFLDRGNPLQVNNLDELGYNNKNSFTSDDLTLENPTYSLQGQMNYKLSDSWTSQTAVSRSVSKSKGLYSYLYESTTAFLGENNPYGVPLEDGVVFSRFMNHQNSTTLATDIQQNFIGDFKIASMRNRVVAGLDYFHQEVRNNSTGYIANGLVYIGNASQANVNNSVYGNFDANAYISNYDSGILSEAGVESLLTGSSVLPSKVKQETYSAYVSDVLNILPQLSTMVSLRIDQFESDENSQTALSPKFGVVYQPIIDKVSLFANYMDGFSNVDPVVGMDNEGNSQTLEFDPEHAKQFEAGTKFHLLNRKLSATLSYYNIQVTDIVVQTGVGEYSQGGEQYSKGFEAYLTTSPIDGLNINAGYSYNDSKLEKGAADFEGKRPESAGPKNLANIWATYQFMQGSLEGFGLGFGGNHVGENLIFNRNLAGTFTIDSYTTLDASLFYKIDKFGITLKLNNLTDEEYYSGWSTVNPQIGRNLTANFTYKF